jgi:hypothetical protein
VLVVVADGLRYQYALVVGCGLTVCPLASMNWMNTWRVSRRCGVNRKNF